jgi:hypothetical protein
MTLRQPKYDKGTTKPKAPIQKPVIFGYSACSTIQGIPESWDHTKEKE